MLRRKLAHKGLKNKAQTNVPFICYSLVYLIIHHFCRKEKGKGGTMNKLNIYQMTMNPCMIDLQAEKSKALRRVIESLKNKFKDVEIGQIKMHSFRPLDNGGYGKYTDFRLDEMEGPAVLVVSSLLDLDKGGTQAYARLNYALSLDKIKAVYITNYNPDVDVSEYIDDLDTIFRNDRSGFIRPKRVEVPEGLPEAIGELRRISPPVILSDIANVTGLHSSMVRRYGSRAALGAGNGVSINSQQVRFLKDVMKKAMEKEFKRYVIKEEKFIDE